jgi:hypothetical protein
VREVLKQVAQAAARATAATAKAVVNAAYSPEMQGKVAQGATEITNALYTGSAYSPYTAATAAHRAQYQAKDQSHAAGQ